MFKFIFTTDHHFSHKPPGRRQGNYFQDLSAKMHQVIDYCDEQGAIPLFGGDLFHLKDPSKIPTFTLMDFLGDMAKLLSGFKTPPLTAVGNHDIRYDRITTLPEQPLGLLAASGVISLLFDFDPLALIEWVGPSGQSHRIPRTLPGKIFKVSDYSYVLVCSTPYMDDPQDLVAYLGSDTYHTALGNFAANGLESNPATNYSLSCILLLHTFSGSSEGVFFGLQRASYPAIHAALAKSALGRATSAVLFGHEHCEMGDYVLPMDQSVEIVNNLPAGYYIATMGTIYSNPGAFARSTLDYDESADEPTRQVNMAELVYTPNGGGLSLAINRIPIAVRPLEQLFGVSADPLNQEVDQPMPEAVPAPPLSEIVWTSFNEALDQITQVAKDPSIFLAKRLESESPKVVVTVKNLISIAQ